MFYHPYDLKLSYFFYFKSSPVQLLELVHVSLSVVGPSQVNEEGQLRVRLLEPPPHTASHELQLDQSDHVPED